MNAMRLPEKFIDSAGTRQDTRFRMGQTIDLLRWYADHMDEHGPPIESEQIDFPDATDCEGVAELLETALRVDAQARKEKPESSEREQLLARQVEELALLLHNILKQFRGVDWRVIDDMLGRHVNERAALED